jgi:tetratricopeptide (TPR) repeat protein
MTEMTPETTESTASTPATAATSTPSGKAGRIDYDKWGKVTKDLVKDVEKEEEQEIEEQRKALGLGGKYARSEAEAEERKKFKDVKKAKKALEGYQKRESQIKSMMVGLLGPVTTDDDDDDNDNDNDDDHDDNSNKNDNDKTPKTNQESKTTTTTDHKVVRITRDMMDAGKRVVSVCDTSGTSPSQKDTIVLTQDLSLLESLMKANTSVPIKPKSYEGDVDNGVKDDTDIDTDTDTNTDNAESPATRSVFGVIKCFISNVHNCTILIKCKLIAGTVELSHCSNVLIRVEKEATVATFQADLCENITIEFRDAPSGKNTSLAGRPPNVYWGEDKEDRIFHAGVKKMLVKVIRDDYVETEKMCDYLDDGAKVLGNATEAEFQFVTSCLDGELITEAVVRAGGTTGTNARAMTRRELEAEKERRAKAEVIAVGMAENMIKFKETGKEVKKVEPVAAVVVPNEQAEEEEDDDIEEVYGSMSKNDIDEIVLECERNKTRGNEAFGAGEYGQAILLYSLALDKAHELPDKDGDMKKPLFPRDVTLSNRAACFLKLGQHEKALEDAKQALEWNPENVKAIFRRGLALHAMGQYGDALPVLATAHKLEPKNKQIKQALQFAEVRLEQEMRKRMAGS